MYELGREPLQPLEQRQHQELLRRKEQELYQEPWFQEPLLHQCWLQL